MGSDSLVPKPKFLNVQWGFYISIFILIAIAVFATWWAQSNFPPEFPLYYSLSYGDSQLADKKQLLQLTGLVVGVSILNILISSFIIKRKTPSRLLLGITSAWLIMYILGLIFIAKRIL